MKSPSLLNLPGREGTFSPSLRTAFFHLGRRAAEVLPYRRLSLIPQRIQPSTETKSAPGHQRILPPRGSRQSPQRERGKQGTAGGSGVASSAGHSAGHRHLPPAGARQPAEARSGPARNGRASPGDVPALGKRPEPLPAASSLHPAPGRDNASAPLQSRGTFPAGATHRRPVPAALAAAGPGGSRSPPRRPGRPGDIARVLPEAPTPIPVSLWRESPRGRTPGRPQPGLGAKAEARSGERAAPGSSGCSAGSRPRQAGTLRPFPFKLDPIQISARQQSG